MSTHITCYTCGCSNLIPWPDTAQPPITPIYCEACKKAVSAQLWRDLEPGEVTQEGDRFFDAYAGKWHYMERTMEVHEDGIFQRPAQWQGIESAPRDGTMILVWAKCPEFYGGPVLSPEVTVGHFDTREGWVSNIWKIAGDGGSSYPIQIEPTRWQPLPEPPRKEEG